MSSICNITSTKANNPDYYCKVTSSGRWNKKRKSSPKKRKSSPKKNSHSSRIHPMAEGCSKETSKYRNENYICDNRTFSWVELKPAEKKEITEFLSKANYNVKMRIDSMSDVSLIESGILEKVLLCARDIYLLVGYPSKSHHHRNAILAVCYVLALQTLIAYDYDFYEGTTFSYFRSIFIISKKEYIRLGLPELYMDIFKKVDYIPCSIHAKDTEGEKLYY